MMDRADYLLAYLRTLVELKKSGYMVFNEISATIAEINEELEINTAKGDQ
ncbi:MAG: hypothetical protein ACQEUT_18260 [Bacillota bacterium]